MDRIYGISKGKGNEYRINYYRNMIIDKFKILLKEAVRFPLLISGSKKQLLTQNHMKPYKYTALTQTCRNDLEYK